MFPIIVLCALILAFLGLFFGGIFVADAGHLWLAIVMWAVMSYLLMVIYCMVVGVESMKAAFLLRKPIAFRKKEIEENFLD